jgi:hypothetical protein
MPERFTVDSLLRAFEPVIEQLPDHRTGRNTTYTISDAVRLARPRFADRASVPLPSFSCNRRRSSPSNRWCSVGRGGITPRVCLG